MTRSILTAALLAATALPAAGGTTAVGLADDRMLILIDVAEARVREMREVALEGRLLGIDWRSPDGTLIGVTDDFRVVRIDPQTGAVAEVVQMDRPLPLAEGVPVVVDINPAADALRFMAGTVNHRVNLTTGAVMVDGALHWAPSAGIAGAPQVVATGYINNLGRPEATAMLNLEAGTLALTRQAPPNDGTNTPIGPLGIAAPEGPMAFDVGTDAAGVNTGWLVAAGMLHRIDLESGAVTESRAVAGLDATLRDLTLMP